MIPTLSDIIKMLLAGECTPVQAQLWLAEHQKLQDEFDALEDVPPGLSRVMLDALKKRFAQDDRWGALDTYQHASFDPTLLASADTDSDSKILAAAHCVPAPYAARAATRIAAATGELSWMLLLVEEVSKLTEHHSNQAALREQCIDVAGVALAWAEALDHQRDRDEQASLDTAHAALVVGNHEETPS
jgi:hypothetical protein